MKREITREKKLPAFELEVTDLQLLWQRMSDLFDDPQNVDRSIDLSLPSESEKLRFDSIEELIAYDQIKGKVTDFTLRAKQGKRSVTLRSSSFFHSVPTVNAEAESAIWCAGAIEAVMGVVRSRRVWYAWFIHFPISLTFFLLALAPFLKSWLLPELDPPSRPVAFAFISIILVFGFLSLTKNKLLPPASITFSNELGFIRRYGAELGLVLGVISLIFTIYGLL